MTVFDTTNKSDHTKSLAFFDPNGGVTIQRYDTLKYKQFDKLTDKQLGFCGNRRKLISSVMLRTLRI